MRVTILRTEGTVGIDGVFRKVDLGKVLKGGAAEVVQYDTDAAKGHVERNDGKRNDREVDPALVTAAIAAWEAAAPPPPTVDELRTAKLAAFEAEAVRRIAALVPEVDSFIAARLLALLWPAVDQGKLPIAAATAVAVYGYLTAEVRPRLTGITDATAITALRPSDAKPFSGSDPGWPT